MKVLLNTCAVILVSYMVGKDIFPEIFRNFFMFWGINIGLVILLAIGFARSLSIYFQKEERTIKSFSNAAWFLLLFLSVLILPITVHYGMGSLNTFELSRNKGLPINDTSSPETEERRKYLAGFLFGQYGTKIPYRLDSGEYKIFQPTEDQVKKYENSLERHKETIDLELQLSKLALLSFNLAITQAVLFFVAFIVTIIYEQKKENKK